MRVSLMATLILLSLEGFGQSKETFLMYEARIESQAEINQDKSIKLIRRDTAFYLSEVVTLDKKITLRSIPFGSNMFPFGNRRSFKYKREGDQITFSEYGKSKVGHILRGSIFRGNYDVGIYFVPFENNGLKIAPFEGQLIHNHERGRKTKYIQDTTSDKRYQKSYLIFFDQPSWVEGGHEKAFMDKKYFNLMALPGMLGWLQLNKTDKDSIWNVSIFSWKSNIKDSTVWHSTLIKRDFLSKQALKGITNNLQGKWSKISGIITKGKLGNDSLKECNYTFTFEKSKLILEQNFSNPIKKSIDTLSYSINPSGDLILAKGKKNRVQIILDKVDSKTAQFSVKDIWEINNENHPVEVLLYLRKE